MRTRGGGASRCIVAAFAVCLAAALPGPGAAGPPVLAQGKLLVANRDLLDPNFARTVVLLIQHGDEGAMGIVINRSLGVKLADVLSEAVPDLQDTAAAEQPLYQGGPVAPTSLHLLIRTEAAPEESVRILEGVYLSQSPELLARLALERGGRRTFRVFAGFAGWAAGQLEGEVERGDWRIVSADADTVFFADPEAIWRSLIPADPSLRVASDPLREPCNLRRPPSV